MYKSLKTLLAAASLVFFGLVASDPAAFAGPVTHTCDTAQMDSSDDCAIGTSSNDIPGGPAPIVVNQDMMFGFSDWDFMGVYDNDDDEAESDIGFAVTGGDLSGTWSVNPGSLSTYEDIMLVIKAGPGYVGFLYELPTDGDSWTLDDDPELSHMTLYVRGTDGVEEVPAPAAFGLILLGLAGMFRMRRRRKKQN